MRPSRRPRLIRGLLAASIATFVALASHVWVGGTMPGMLGIAVPWMLSVMVCTLLAGRQLSLLRLSASVLLSQALFHVLFVLGAITPQTGPTAHDHGAPILLPATGAVALVPEDAGMWLAHVAAAVCTIALLHRGERTAQALSALAAELVAWARRLIIVPVPAPAPVGVRRRWAITRAPLRRDPLRSALRRRGPPLRLI